MKDSEIPVDSFDQLKTGQLLLIKNPFFKLNPKLPEYEVASLFRRDGNKYWYSRMGGFGVITEDRIEELDIKIITKKHSRYQELVKK